MFNIERQERSCVYAVNLIFSASIPMPVPYSILRLAYSMKLDYDSRGGGYRGSGIMALLPPKVNVSSHGYVPTSPQVFAIRLPCSGIASAEIKLALKINVSAPAESRYDDTRLVFKRNKICMQATELRVALYTYSSFFSVRRRKFSRLNAAVARDRVRRSFEAHIRKIKFTNLKKKNSTLIEMFNINDDQNDSVTLQAGPLANNNGAFYIAASCACALILVVVGVASVIYIRNSKARSQLPRKNLNYCSYSATGTGALTGSSILVKVDNRPGSANSGSYATIADLEPLYARPCGSRASYYAASHVTHLSQVQDFGRGDRLVMRLAATAGRVEPLGGLQRRSAQQQQGVDGSMRKSSSRGGCQVRAQVSKRHTRGYFRSSLSRHFEPRRKRPGGHHQDGHRRSLGLSGLSARLGGLAAGRPDTRQHHDPGGGLPRRRRQSAAGLLLHAQRSQSQVLPYRRRASSGHEGSRQRRRADSASWRFPPRPRYTPQRHSGEKLPIGWMALETLQHGQYSTASDSWSFGVFLWELATMGQQPYAEVDPFELTAFLRDGYRLSQPRPCPDELFALMAVCWLGPSRDRPTMPQLLAYLQEFYDALGGFI
uniref:WIF domain-containing protein n=1 Tax=Trichogramma kaykai TaxID=54128 RepID=A0ABD2VSN8_9HYME